MNENNQQPKERPRFWTWGDPVTVRNPIREAWEQKQKEKARKQFEKFIKERQANDETT